VITDPLLVGLCVVVAPFPAEAGRGRLSTGPTITSCHTGIAPVVLVCGQSCRWW